MEFVRRCLEYTLAHIGVRLAAVGDLRRLNRSIVDGSENPRLVTLPGSRLTGRPTMVVPVDEASLGEVSRYKRLVYPQSLLVTVAAVLTCLAVYATVKNDVVAPLLTIAAAVADLGILVIVALRLRTRPQWIPRRRGDVIYLDGVDDEVAARLVDGDPASVRIIGPVGNARRAEH